jgi:hypothetical protein
MFSNDDFEMINRTEDTAPDGMLDASDYQMMNEVITKYLADTDFHDVESKMHFTMKVINLFATEDGEDVDPNNVFGVVLALTFHVTNIFAHLQESDMDNLKDYFKYIQEELLPSMKEESSSLPYWEM